MQLTLDDLRKASDPLALLLGADDEALDRVSALIQGWKDIDIDECPPHGAWVKSNKGGVRKEDWQPSRDLGQAYELLGFCRAKCDLYHSRVEDWHETYHELGKPNDADGFHLWESQAGSHARAVCVLAILGLLQSRKDGGA